jgi:hypothetical protein
MSLKNNKQGLFFGPVQVYMGYIFIACGLLFISYSVTTLLLVIPGAFMAFTSNGTLIDTDNRRVKPYTTFFGVFQSGRWIDVSDFSGLRIVKSDRRYTSYSITNMKLDLKISDVCLLMINKTGRRKIVLNRYKNPEDARKELHELEGLLFPGRREDTLING